VSLSPVMRMMPSEPELKPGLTQLPSWHNLFFSYPGEI
jgi:hypothetical protein